MKNIKEGLTNKLDESLIQQTIDSLQQLCTEHVTASNAFGKLCAEALPALQAIPSKKTKYERICYQTSILEVFYEDLQKLSQDVDNTTPEQRNDIQRFIQQVNNLIDNPPKST